MKDQNTTTQPATTGLVVLLTSNNIGEETALELSSSFAGFYDQANEWKIKAAEHLNNPDLSPEEKAAESRKARLALVKVRTGIEKKRKELNEDDNKKITDRNSAAKILTALVTPIEALLEAEEKKQENIEKERRATIKKERLEKIAPYNVDCTFFDLENMPEEAFDVLLENSRLAFERKADDEKKMLEARDKEMRTNNRAMELVLLGFEFDESDGSYHNSSIQAQIPRTQLVDSTNEIWSVTISSIRTAIEIFNAEAAAKKKAEEDKLKAEKEKAEREAALLIQQKKEAEEKHKIAISKQIAFVKINYVADYDFCFGLSDQAFNEMFAEENSKYQDEQNRLFIEQKKREREEALAKAELAKKAEEERLALLAPDKEKLKLAVSSISFLFEVKEHQAALIGKDILMKVEGLKKWAYEQINTLK